MPRKTTFKISLGNRIKELRIFNNLTQEELGKKLNVGKTTIANYESGYSEPEGEKLLELAKIFNVSIDYMLGKIRTKLPITILTNLLASNNLNENELENVCKKIKEYYSGEKYIINPIDFNELTINEQRALRDFFIITSDYFSNKLNIELGDDFELFDDHTEETIEKLATVKEYIGNKIDEIISNLDKKSILNGTFKNLTIYNNNTLNKLNHSMSSFDDFIYAYKVNDESMFPLMGTGDTAIIEKKEDYDNGKTYLLQLDDNKILIRKILDFKDSIELHTATPYSQPLTLTQEEIKKRNLKIFGKVIRVENSSAFK